MMQSILADQPFKKLTRRWFCSDPSTGMASGSYEGLAGEYEGLAGEYEGLAGEWWSVGEPETEPEEYIVPRTTRSDQRSWLFGFFLCYAVIVPIVGRIYLPVQRALACGLSGGREGWPTKSMVAGCRFLLRRERRNAARDRVRRKNTRRVF
jgi:hypothetical protein